MKFKIVISLLFFALNVYTQNFIEYEIYKFPPNQDTMLETNLGTKIKIRGNSFKFLEDTTIIKNTITLKIKEIVDQNDMILQGISTTTEDGILTSNGMILLEGYSNTKIVKIKETKSIIIEIPASSGLTNMDIYTMNDGTKNWKKNNTEISFDTCSTYKQHIITRDKTVSKSKYKEWKKKQKEKGEPEERLFGGRTINIGGGRRPKKSYNILVPIDTMWMCDGYDMSYYSFSINSLGWYNVDKLKNVKRPIDLIVSTEEDLDIFLLLKKENICIRATKTKNGEYIFGRIPRVKNAQIIGYKQNDNKTVNMTMQNVYLKNGKVKLKQSKKMSIGEFKRIIKIKK